MELSAPLDKAIQTATPLQGFGRLLFWAQVFLSLSSVSLEIR